MKHKIKLIILFSVIGIFLAAAYYVFASFNGSIIMRMITTAKVKDYVAEKYANEPYDVSFARYDFKSVDYFCNVQSSESEDTHFIVWNTGDGLRDDFDTSVNGRHATLFRLQRELDDYFESFMKKAYPHRTSLVLCDLISNVDDADVKELTLDMPFDVKSFPLPTSVTVWVETAGESPTWEELAERFRELDLLIHDEIPSVMSYSVCVQPKYIEKDGEIVPSNYDLQICAYDVPRDVILSGGLEEYLAKEKAAQDAEIQAINNGEYTKPEATKEVS